MVETKVKTRGEVAPGKIQTNWRIGEREYTQLKLIAPDYGFSSVPACVNFILNRVLNDPKLLAAVFGERK